MTGPRAPRAGAPSGHSAPRGEHVGEHRRGASRMRRRRRRDQPRPPHRHRRLHQSCDLLCRRNGGRTQAASWFAAPRRVQPLFTITSAGEAVRAAAPSESVYQRMAWTQAYLNRCVECTPSDGWSLSSTAYEAALAFISSRHAIGNRPEEMTGSMPICRSQWVDRTLDIGQSALREIEVAACCDRLRVGGWNWPIRPGRIRLATTTRVGRTDNSDRPPRSHF